MKVRNSKNVTLDEIQFFVSKGATLHPELYTHMLAEFEDLERKGKLSRLPSTILETYSIDLQARMEQFEESCRQHQLVISSYFN